MRAPLRSPAARATYLGHLAGDPVERLAGLIHELHALAHLGHGRVDQGLDLLGGLGRALGERADLGSDDGEAAIPACLKRRAR
jgi:hypothetical protein